MASRMLSPRKMVDFLVLIVATAPLILAHSWIEEYQVILPNGSYVGARGYSRGYVDRTAPGYNGESDKYQLPSLDARNNDGTVRNRINSSDLLCHPSQRKTSAYTADYPKLQVQPGSYVAMKYLENGHVSLPWNITGKPPGGGTVYVFGTTQPSDEEKITDVMKWNDQGTGGDKRGFLMTAQNFDDGRCHQINCGYISTQRQMLKPDHVEGQPTSTVESWCETDLKIPENTTPGLLTTYWIWQWPTEPNMDCTFADGKDEYYTTCADFDVVDSSAVQNKALAAPFSAGAGQNPQSVAVKEFKSRTAYSALPSMVLDIQGKIVGQDNSVSSAFLSSCSAQASVISANSLGLWPQVYVPNTCSVVSTFGSAAAASAAADFASAAASYSAQSSSVWSAAFAKANLAVPTPSPWSIAPNMMSAQPSSSATDLMPTSTGHSTQAVASSTMPAASIAPAATGTITTSQSPEMATSLPGSEMVDVTTVTTVVVVTSVLAIGQSVPASEEVSSSTSSTLSSTTTTSADANTIPDPRNPPTIMKITNPVPSDIAPSVDPQDDMVEMRRRNHARR